MSPVVVIFGADGVVGRYLTRYFALRGREVVAVARRRDGWSGDGMFLEWDGSCPGPWSLALEGAEAVIHVEGWDAEGDRDQTAPLGPLVESRLAATRAIGKALAACRIPPQVWIHASSVAWYRADAACPQDDWTGEPGNGAASNAAKVAEEAFFALPAPAVTRKVAVRLGSIWVDESGPAGDVLGSREEAGHAPPDDSAGVRVSWIHIEDFLRGIEFVVQDPFLGGTLNLTAPECPTMTDLGRCLEASQQNSSRKAVGTALGEGSLVPAGSGRVGRWVAPVRLRDAGFCWLWPAAQPAIRDLRQSGGLDGFFRTRSSRPDVPPVTPLPQGQSRAATPQGRKPRRTAVEIE